MPETSTAAAPPPPPWWLWPQILSLDAPLVAVGWMAVLERSHRLHLPPVFYWGLALVTWLVYVLDRTADAVSGRLQPPLSARHSFYQRRSKLMLRLVLPLASLAALWIALNEIPVGLVRQGIVLCLAGMIYLATYSTSKRSHLHLVLLFLGVTGGVILIESWHVPPVIRIAAIAALLAMTLSSLRDESSAGMRHYVPKEFIASLLFALGSSAGVHFWTPSEHGLLGLCNETWLMWGLFATNMASIARAEHLAGVPADPMAASPIRTEWHKAALWWCAVLLVVSLIQAFDARNPGTRNTALVVAVAAALLALLNANARRLRCDLFHVLADAALLIPLPLAWIIR